MRERVARATNLAVSAAIAATRPAVGAGASCAGWYEGGFAPGRVLITLDGTQAATVADPTDGTGGVELWGQVNSEMKLITYLFAGADIPIVSTTQGWAAVVDLGVGYERLAIAGTPSGGTITATYTPVEVQR